MLSHVPVMLENEEICWQEIGELTDEWRHHWQENRSQAQLSLLKRKAGGRIQRTLQRALISSKRSES